mgnify:CR=1 FL=1
MIIECKMTLYVSREIDYDNFKELRDAVASFEDSVYALQTGFSLPDGNDGAAYDDRGDDGNVYFVKDGETVYLDEYIDRIIGGEADDEVDIDDDMEDGNTDADTFVNQEAATRLFQSLLAF